MDTQVPGPLSHEVAQCDPTSVSRTAPRTTRSGLDVLAAAAIAPIVWGSTYAVTTTMLPSGYPLTDATIRALPAGIILMAFARQVPTGRWIYRCLILGALNFSVFWWLLFVSAYRLPGGVAATVGALQPLLVLFLSAWMLGTAVTPGGVAATMAGVIGVAMVVLSSSRALDGAGLVAAGAGAVSMAIGTVLSKKWQPPVPALVFTGWQLTAGGLLLLPVAITFEPPLPALSIVSFVGFAYLALFGGALTYFLWFRGIARLGPTAVAPLGLLSPISAALLGIALVGDRLGLVQWLGIGIVLASVLFGHRAQARAARPRG